METHNEELATQAQKLAEQVDKLEKQEKNNKAILAKHDLRASTLKTISKEVDAETEKTKSMERLFPTAVGTGRV